MAKSHTTGWALDAPTPAQMKELFAQVESGKLTKKHIQALLRGEVQVSASFTTDLTQYNIEVVKGKKGPPHLEGVTVADLELKGLLCRDERYINEKELRKRAREFNVNLGLHTAEYLLEHQDEISKDWQGKHLVFPGTELRDSDGRRRVPFLYWDGGRWSLLFLWLGTRFYSSDYFVRLRT